MNSSPNLVDISENMKKHRDSKVLSFKEVQDLIKVINSTLDQKQLDEITDELGIETTRAIKLDNLLTITKEKRKSSRFSNFYGNILNYFITPSERIVQILEDSKNKLAEFKEHKLVEDLEWVIKKINSDDLYNLSLDNFFSEEKLLMKAKDKALDLESTLSLFSEYSKDNFDKNKKSDIDEARRLSNKKMNLNFRRSLSHNPETKNFKQDGKFDRKKSSFTGVRFSNHKLLQSFDEIKEDEKECDKSQSLFRKRESLVEKIGEIEKIESIKEENSVSDEENDLSKTFSNEDKIEISKEDDSDESSKIEENNMLRDINLNSERTQSFIGLLEEDDFNIFDFAQKIGRNNVLKEISNAIFERHSLFRLINKERFDTFLDKIRVGYDYLLPYHNELHAADVLQTCNIFYKYCNLNRQIDVTSLDISAYFIAAIIHDLGHPGLTNNYHINKRTSISIKYNDMSVLENLHVSSAFKIISHPNSNIFCDLSVEEYRVVRKRIVECVLATDMAKHTKSQISLKIKIDRLSKASSENILSRFITEASEDSIFERQQEIFNFFIHCADISNPGKKLKVSKIWTNLIIEEFFNQGDIEKKENLPVSFLCDRKTTNIPKSQVLFMTNIVLPSFKIISLFSNKLDFMTANIYENVEYWKKKEAESNKILK